MKHKRIFPRLFAVCIFLTLLIALTVTSTAALTPDTGLPVLKGQIRTRLPELFTVGETDRAGSVKLTVGGTAFGVRLFSEGVQIVRVSDGQCPATQAGLKKKDRILSIDGQEMRTVSDVVDAIEGSEGKALTLRCRRGEEELTVTMTPAKDASGKYRAGIWVRDNAAGIGTLTFVNRKTGAFGGLGHGICDADTGELLSLTRGAVMDAEISGVVRGTEGSPGELKGYLCSQKIGTLLLNCDRGVFGVMSPVADELGEEMEVGGRDTIHAGEALLRCTLEDGKTTDYRIELSDIHPENTGAKCFAVHVTDPRLLERTGGIVQGMSGSPILQDGKLVGAVTHVLIGDPTRGYGIFIDNMLAAMPKELL
jgi:stage IV sporulation protein B